VKARSAPKRAWGAVAAEIIAGNNRCRRAADAVIRHLKDTEYVPEPNLDDFGVFSEEEIKAIWTIAYKTKRERFEDFDEREFAKAMDKTAPVLARRRWKDTLLDLWRMLAQPELIALWAGWNGRVGRRGKDPGFFAKALLVVTAALSISPYFTENYKFLRDGAGGRVPRVFEWLEQTAAARSGRSPQPFGDKANYEKAVEQVRLIVDQTKNWEALTSDRVIETNVELLKGLSDFHPSIGSRLAIDATWVEAHVEQVPRQQNPEAERRIRRRAPNATFRSFDEKVLGRGYFLYVLTDIATNLPVTWGLYPGGGLGGRSLEVAALRFLLNDLFEKWPDCPLRMIVADRAWDDVEAVRLCAENFGVHLIVGRDKPSWDRKPTLLSSFDSETIGGFDGRGVVYCRQHGEPMKRVGAAFAGRDKRRALGLQPGDRLTTRSEFRLRLKCAKGGGACDAKAQLHMDRDWAALSYYPHTKTGGRKIFMPCGSRCLRDVTASKHSSRRSSARTAWHFAAPSGRAPPMSRRWRR
jgi:hypothetical protein